MAKIYTVFCVISFHYSVCCRSYLTLHHTILNDFKEIFTFTPSSKTLISKTFNILKSLVKILVY